MIRRRVLLLSPMPGLDPPNGDVVYTQSLLDHPPPGVEYETYPEALKAGRLRELGRRAELDGSSSLLRIGALARIAREQSINALRKREILFREPFRYFSVAPGSYDLVHCHVFGAAFKILDAPLVMSNACVIEELYRGAVGWSERHIATASRIDAALARSLHVQHASHAMPDAAAVVCFTEHLRQELFRRGSTTPERLHVVPCFTEPGPRIEGRARPSRIGFIAGDFEAKGGPVVLSALDVVRRERPDVELTIVGSEPRGTPDRLRARGITWLPWLDRVDLLENHVPTFDVFAYPTNFDGLPLTVLEIMARGIPIATDDYNAMPEIVGLGEAGSVTPQRDADALAQALLALLEPEENARARTHAAAWFDSHYAPDVAIPKLAAAYDAAIASGPAGQR